MPQPPWSWTLLPTMVSFCPPAISIPVPTGTVPASPEPGALGLLFPCTKLPRMIVHEPFPYGPGWPWGQAPFWGEGASSLFRLFGTMPDRFRSNSVSWMIRWPPEFVPEYPSALFSAWPRIRTVLQSGQAPM